MLDYTTASGPSGFTLYSVAYVTYYISKILKCPRSQAHMTPGVSDKKLHTCSYYQSLNQKSPFLAEQVGQLPVITEQIWPRPLSVSVASV